MTERRPESTPRHRAAAATRGLGSVWGLAVVLGVAAAAVTLVAAEAVAVAVAFLFAAATHSRVPVATTARLGDALFLWFHHAGLVFRATGRPAGSVLEGRSLSFGFSLSVAVMGGTVLAAWLLAMGGRAVARTAAARPAAGRSGLPPTLVGGLHGVAVAPPYAAACAAASLGARLAARLPFNPVIPPVLAIRPGYASAFVSPLLLGAVAGFLGGALGRRRRPRPSPGGVGSRDRRERMLAGALAGGTRMTAVALGGSFVGLAALGAVHPSATKAYFDGAFRDGPRRGAAVVAATALVTPNMASWVLFPSMGSCVAVSGAGSGCVLSYRHFPTAAAGPRLGGAVGRILQTGPGQPAPVGYLLFLAVPVVAVVVGGARAAARSRARSRAEAVVAGVAAGVVFGGLCLLLVVLSAVSGTVEAGLGRTASSSFRVGPDLLPSVALSLAWGLIGGAAGGLARGAVEPVPAIPPPSGAETEAQAPSAPAM